MSASPEPAAADAALAALRDLTGSEWSWDGNGGLLLELGGSPTLFDGDPVAYIEGRHADPAAAAAVLLTRALTHVAVTVGRDGSVEVHAQDMSDPQRMTAAAGLAGASAVSAAASALQRFLGAATRPPASGSEPWLVAHRWLGGLPAGTDWDAATRRLWAAAGIPHPAGTVTGRHAAYAAAVAGDRSTWEALAAAEPDSTWLDGWHDLGSWARASTRAPLTSYRDQMRPDAWPAVTEMWATLSVLAPAP